MEILSIVRMAVFVLVTIFGISLIGLSGHYLSSRREITITTRTGTIYEEDYYYTPAAAHAGLGVAAGVLTMISLPVMFAIDWVRKGAITSKIVVEYFWLQFLAVLFFASGIAAIATYGHEFVSSDSFAVSSCGQLPERTLSLPRQWCGEDLAITGLGLTIWLIIQFYVSALVIFTILAARRTNARTAWMSSARDVRSLKKGDEVTAGEKPAVITSTPNVTQTQPLMQPQSHGQQQQGAYPPMNQGTYNYASPHSQPAPGGQYGHPGQAPSGQAHSAYPQV